MNLSPSAWVQAIAPWVLTGAAVALALILAVLGALFAVPYFLLRFRSDDEASASEAPKK
ncbi:MULTISPECIES: hypothetical protein [unclassified Streptomyces]|uniref:hypothetical protein n=1 Tax=unclassified Streptomyces TaxID=2593676 RepID=UPI00202E5F42|nr:MULTISPECIES: hypothetical protein [unclassified Streptomyces]MCM1967289.1 hypothetical protein [Streptomyces sp. G1]MCX5127901.1 hypothetical protein [Streptomyces sp. NBC_00347]